MTALDKPALLALLIEQQVLKFGDFTLKSGRRSPYFFNLGELSTGSAIARLGEAYAARVSELDVTFDVVFGPAYKGIPIAVATAQALASRGRDVGWAFDRKEAKDHGEGGRFVGADISGRIVLVDDVLTAGTALRAAASLLLAAGATIAAIVIALDRQEKRASGATAVTELAQDLGVPVVSMLNLQDVIEYLDLTRGQDNHAPTVLAAIEAYQAEYCEVVHAKGCVDNED
jgi:orotate phosphoribosyltransferase